MRLWILQSCSEIFHLPAYTNAETPHHSLCTKTSLTLCLPQAMGTSSYLLIALLILIFQHFQSKPGTVLENHPVTTGKVYKSTWPT